MNIKIFGLATAAVAALASSASAGLVVGDTITLSRITTSPGRLVTINFDGSITSSSSAARTGGDAAQAGQQNFDHLLTNGNTAYGTIVAFCAEVAEAFPDDPIQYTMVDPTGVPEEAPPGNMSANQSALMQDLYAKQYADVANTSNDGSWSNASDESAAFQLVVWEISHESFTSTTLAGMAGELSLSLGAFQATDTYNANVATIASGMIAGLGGGSGFELFSSLLGGTNPDNQDLLIVVPSPAIAGLAGLGLVGMRRRRR